MVSRCKTLHLIFAFHISDRQLGSVARINTGFGHGVAPSLAMGELILASAFKSFTLAAGSFGSFPAAIDRCTSMMRRSLLTCSVLG